MTCAPDDFFQIIKSRRVVRSFSDEPVSDDALWQIAQAGRWASSGGNRHIHKFLILRDPAKIQLVRSFSPGMLAPPPALVIICTDHERARQEMIQLDEDYANWVDVGTAAMNMMNMVHAMGLGACPVTSFSRSGVAGVLDFPDLLTPELQLMVGHPRPVDRGLRSNAPKAITTKEITFWDKVGRHDR
jgi:nitroreductase